MKEEIKKELEALESSLTEKVIPTRPSLPENYFAKMQESVLEDIQTPPAQAVEGNNLWASFSRVFNSIFQIPPSYALAGLAILIMATVAILNFSANPVNPELAAADSTSPIETYLDTHIEEFDESLFVELFYEDATSSIEHSLSAEELYLEESLDDFDIQEIEELL